jgi:hypothetical protein
VFVPNREYKFNAKNISILYIFEKKFQMQELLVKTYLKSEAKAWLKYRDGSREVVKIVPDTAQKHAVQCYEIYTAYDQPPVYMGRILFDAKGYWIYDGDVLQPEEQEQLAHFITTYVERI